MGTPHVHAEVIKAWADGAQVQIKGPVGEWYDFVSSRPSWIVTSEYRVKPETLRYRVALFKREGDGYFVNDTTDQEQADRWGGYGHFIRWLTDWVEVEV